MRRLLLLLLLVPAVLALAGCEGPDSTEAATTAAQEPPPLPADVREVGAVVAPAESGTMVPAPAGGETLVSTGELISPVRSEVAAKIIGRVARVYVEEGSRVTRGQPLLELETDYLRLNLQAAEAEAARAQAMLSEAERDLGRKSELIGKGSIPQATFDRSQAGFDQARAAHAGAAAQVALLRQQIADSTLRAPISGVVESKQAEIGQKLGDGAVPFVIAQTSPLRLRFSVPERYLGRIKRGQRVVARVDPYPNETFVGSIRTLAGVIDPRTRTMFAEAELANADGRLRPGLFARVETKMD
ncbi:MAG TPA: efflux RND transporter periplasmic adaptor subunit [Thermoanaerobaculia bacterium]|nr:efflux RND transporter periplasmic adaptor subunit [Thermoanaerobaculia bacterium]